MTMLTIVEFKVDLRRYEDDGIDFTMTCVGVNDRIYLKAIDVNRFIGQRKIYHYPKSCNSTSLKDLYVKGVVSLRRGLVNMVLYDIPNAIRFAQGKDELKGNILRKIFVENRALVYLSERPKIYPEPLPSVSAMIDVEDRSESMKSLYKPMSEILCLLHKAHGQTIEENQKTYSAFLKDKSDTTYDNVVERILNVPILKRYVSKEERSGTFLNLISVDWRKRLAEYDVYQRHVNDVDRSLFQSVTKTNRSEKQSISCQSDKFNVMLAFPCRVSQKTGFGVFSNESEPLLIIAKALTSDKMDDYKLAPFFKLVANMCNQNCEACIGARETFVAAGYEIGKDNPCIRKTWVIENDGIVARFASTIKSSFGNEKFTTIVKLEIDTRITYLRNADNEQFIRIGGNVIKILAFANNLLEQRQVVPFLGHLKPNIPTATNVPSETQNGKRPRQAVNDKDEQNDSTTKKKRIKHSNINQNSNTPTAAIEQNEQVNANVDPLTDIISSCTIN